MCIESSYKNCAALLKSSAPCFLEILYFSAILLCRTWPQIKHFSLYVGFNCDEVGLGVIDDLNIVFLCVSVFY